MALITSVQANAMERLRSTTPPAPTRAKGQTSAQMAEAERAWAKLKAAIDAACAQPNELLTLSVSELEALHATATAGQDLTGWVNPYPKDDPRSLLKRYQFISHHDDSDSISDVWSRQVGKGFTVACLIAERCFKQPRCRYTITSPSERQSLLTLDKCKDMVEAFGLMVEGREIERDGSHPQALITSTKITLSNGSVIRGVPGLPQTLRGDTANLVIDEGDHVDNPTEFMRAVLGLIANEETGRKQLRYITTPNGKTAPSYGQHHPQPGDEGLWSCRRINIWQAVLMGIKQNPHKLRKLLNDPHGWAQEYLCEWIEATTTAFPYELIARAQSVECSEQWTLEQAAASKFKLVAGIDFGGINDPSVMDLAEAAGGRSYGRHLEKLKGQSTPEQVRHLTPWLDLCSRICVDYTGPGRGFGDMLVEKYGEWCPAKERFGRVELVTFSTPVKRDLFSNLRLGMERGQCFVPYCDWLREDIHAMRQVMVGNEYSYEAPNTKAGHSDGCCAVALRHRAASGPQQQAAAESIPTTAYADDDDPSLMTRVGRALRRRLIG